MFYLIFFTAAQLLPPVWHTASAGHEHAKQVGKATTCGDTVCANVQAAVKNYTALCVC